jgi:hypothetical protein
MLQAIRGSDSPRTAVTRQVPSRRQTSTSKLVDNAIGGFW